MRNDSFPLLAPDGRSLVVAVGKYTSVDGIFEKGDA